MSMEKNHIVAGFPGVGKSAAARKCVDYIDMESSAYHWTTDATGETYVNPEWPRNYVDAILETDKNNTGKVILTSSHESVIELLTKQRHIIVVVPGVDQRNEYLIRYLRRGDPVDFINGMATYWHKYLDGITKKWYEAINGKANGYPADPMPKYTVIYLNEGQNLIDVLPAM